MLQFKTLVKKQQSFGACHACGFIFTWRNFFPFLHILRIERSLYRVLLHLVAIGHIVNELVPRSTTQLCALVAISILIYDISTYRYPYCDYTCVCVCVMLSQTPSAVTGAAGAQSAQPDSKRSLLFVVRFALIEFDRTCQTM